MSRTPAPASYMGIPVHRLPKLAEFKAGAPRQNRMLSELSGCSNTLVAPLTTAFRVLDLTAANTQAGYTRFNPDNPSFNAASGLNHMKTRSTASKEGVTNGGFGAVTFHHLLYANGTNRPHRGIVLRSALSGDTMGHLRATETKILYELKRRQQSIFSSERRDREEGDVDSIISEMTNTSWRALLSISPSGSNNQHRRGQPQNVAQGVLDGSSSLTAVPGQGFLFKSKGSSSSSTTNTPTPTERATQQMEALIPRLGFEVGQRESIEWLGGVLNPHRLEKSKSNDLSFFGNGGTTSATSSGGVNDVGLTGKDATLQAGYFPASVGIAPPPSLLMRPSVIIERTNGGDEQQSGAEGVKDNTNNIEGDSNTATVPLFDAPSDTAYGVSEPWRMGTSIEPQRRVVVEDEFVSYYSDAILPSTPTSTNNNAGVSYTRAMEGLLKSSRGTKRGSGGPLPLSWNIIKRPFFQHSLKETMLVPTTRLLLRFHVPVAIADMCISQNDQKAFTQVKQGHRAHSAVYGNNTDVDGEANVAAYTSNSILLPTASVDRLVSDTRAIYGESDDTPDTSTTPQMDGKRGGGDKFRTMHQRMSRSVDNFGTDRPAHEVRIGPGDIVFVPRGWKYELLREIGRSATDLLATARKEGGVSEEGGSRGKGRGAVQLLVADSIVKDNGAMPGGKRKYTHTSLLVNTNALKAAAASPLLSQSDDTTSDTATTEYVPEYRRRANGWGVGTVPPPTAPTPAPTPKVHEPEAPASTATNSTTDEDDEPSRLLSCDCFKVSFRPFPVLTEKQREIYLSSDYGTSVLDFYDKGGNDPLKHFVH